MPNKMLYRTPYQLHITLVACFKCIKTLYMSRLSSNVQIVTGRTPGK